MTDTPSPATKSYIQQIIEPLYTKLQQLQKQNQQLKRRVTCLESHITIQTNKSYMKNTVSRESHLEGSRIGRRDDDNRSMSGSKEKPGWQRSTKLIEEEKLGVIQGDVAHHEKLKLKPPIPRMSSRTPSKNQEDAKRLSSPGPSEKKIVGGIITRAQKQQISSPQQQKPTIQSSENLVSPRNSTQKGRQFDDPSASNVSKTSSIKLGKPNIYIQKEAKLNSVSSPRQTPLQRSNLTEKPISGGSQVTQENSSPKLVKSQLSINSDKKSVKVEIEN